MCAAWWRGVGLFFKSKRRPLLLWGLFQVKQSKCRYYNRWSVNHRQSHRLHLNWAYVPEFNSLFSVSIMLEKKSGCLVKCRYLSDSFIDLNPIQLKPSACPLVTLHWAIITSSTAPDWQKPGSTPCLMYQRLLLKSFQHWLKKRTDDWGTIHSITPNLPWARHLTPIAPGLISVVRFMDKSISKSVVWDLEGFRPSTVCQRHSPQSRRRAGGPARPAGGQPRPDWRWSS